MVLFYGEITSGTGSNIGRMLDDFLAITECSSAYLIIWPDPEIAHLLRKPIPTASLGPGMVTIPIRAACNGTEAVGVNEHERGVHVRVQDPEENPGPKPMRALHPHLRPTPQFDSLEPQTNSMPQGVRTERLQARARARIYSRKVRCQAGHVRCTSGALLAGMQIRGLQFCAHRHRVGGGLDKTESAQQVWRHEYPAAGGRAGLQVERRKKRDLRAQKEKESETLVRQRAHRYTTVNSVRHVLALLLVRLRTWVVITGKLGSEDALRLSWEHISGCALEHGKMSKVGMKTEVAMHWVDEHHCTDSALCWGAESSRTNRKSEAVGWMS
ncbi:hypothetical protein B0H13DRAFT_1898273 [Mycena leptocephala]|nr:hypothetical protein B0H13DRAFT_1898273 [Mycena leptocephala]